MIGKSFTGGNAYEFTAEASQQFFGKTVNGFTLSDEFFRVEFSDGTCVEARLQDGKIWPIYCIPDELEPSSVE